MEIKLLEHDTASPCYMATLLLRNKVLRQPLGLLLTDADLKQDLHSRIYSALNDADELCGSLMADALPANRVKLRQVAVWPQYEGENIGSRLLAFAEERSRAKGNKAVELNARATAVEFFRKNGYEVEGEVFEEVTIPHFKMTKEL